MWFSDYEHVFVETFAPNNFTPVILHQAAEGIFPCTPSFSRANVSLGVLRSGTFENVLLSKNNGGGKFLYAPTRGGIIVPFPTRTMEHKTYECYAEIGGPEFGQIQNDSMRVKVMKFYPSTNFVPSPNIDTTGAKHVVEEKVSEKSKFSQKRYFFL